MGNTISEGSNLEKSYIAFFDLDHTIISLNSGKALLMQAYETKMINRTVLIKTAFFSLLYKMNLADPVTLLKKVVFWLKGKDEELLQTLVNEVFEKQLKISVRKEIETEIELHRKNRAMLVVLSSSIHPICKAIAIHLNFDYILCSELEVENGKFTGQVKGDFCLNEGKVIRMEELSRKMNISTSSSFYYGDSIEDLPVLKVIGNPVCVSPDKKLTKIALKNGWRII